MLLRGASDVYAEYGGQSLPRTNDLSGCRTTDAEIVVDTCRKVRWKDGENHGFEGGIH